MTAEQVKEQIAFERSLKVGDKCMAYWTNCGSYYEAQVEVVTVNSKSFGVKIVSMDDQLVGDHIVYPVGHKLNIPAFMNTNKWSWNNRLAPGRNHENHI